MEWSKETKQNWAGAENLDYCICVTFLTTITKVLFLKGRQGTRLYLYPILTLSLKETRTNKKTIISRQFFTETILEKTFGTKWRNQVKLERSRKLWLLLQGNFWLLLKKKKFWKDDRALGFISIQLWHFVNIS